MVAFNTTETTSHRSPNSANLLESLWGNQFIHALLVELHLYQKTLARIHCFQSYSIPMKPKQMVLSLWDNSNIPFLRRDLIVLLCALVKAITASLQEGIIPHAFNLGMIE